ncbi:Thiamine-phosphate synthase [Posidoniimonas polymericola]|uniref:Thiamine-phosphate synthase n=1 Tax=Posidoniimonas polymericola TaxID=2528002 RepID=A0A5C5YS55_9BACT|nr:thiamine phosphate synthase [Posidoniimonas polymericola]TWT77755.1 Thiamine-phosphate synthase [Posidoniimonas polymericola]
MDAATLRILDASLNRAAEGLRVVEDYSRFVLDDGHLSKSAKQLRHDLNALAQSCLPHEWLHAARDTPGDVGATITTDAERTRATPWDVCAASLKRVEQSLRSIEEYGKLIDGRLVAGAEQLRYRTYTLEKALDTLRGCGARLTDCRLCVLIDGGPDGERFKRLVDILVAAGVGMLQLRDKQLESRALLDRARALVQATRGTPTLALINDRADIAAAAAADGVHLGQEDLTVADARRILGAEALIGVSTHNLAQARQAVLDGASYLGAGPTFESKTKSFESFAGLDYLGEVSTEVSLPTFAIGGITVENLPKVVATGAKRIAVASAVTAAADPAAAARGLMAGLVAGD